MTTQTFAWKVMHTANSIPIYNNSAVTSINFNYERQLEIDFSLLDLFSSAVIQAIYTTIQGDKSDEIV